MKLKLLTWTLALIFLLIPLASAITTYEEQSSVARVVGESPSELLRQMQRDSINISHTTLFSVDQGSKKSTILDKQFQDDKDIQVFNWDHEEVKSTAQQLTKEELFVIDTFSKNSKETLSARRDLIQPNDIPSWNLEATNPLIVWDSAFVGAFFPKQDSFASRIVRDATLIAPTSFNSPQFTRSVLCRLHDEKTVGQLFKEARNFHYNGGSQTSRSNYIGLVLQSYALYGNPRQVIDMDFSKSDWEQEEFKKLCKNHLENTVTNIEVLSVIGNQTQLRKHIEFSVDEYSLTQVNNVTIIESDATTSEFTPGELVLPKATKTTLFPKNAIITDVHLTSIENPQSLLVSDLAGYDQELTHRTCYTDTQEHHITFENTYTDTSQNVIAQINPVDIINCTTGELTAYKKVTYAIDYLVSSPLVITHVHHPLVHPASSVVNVSISTLGISSTPENGTLVITENNQVIWEKEISSEKSLHHAPFFLPDQEQSTSYFVEFRQENQTLMTYPFEITSTLLDIQAEIPYPAREQETIPIKLTWHGKEPTTLLLKARLANNGETVQTDLFNLSIEQDRVQNLVLTNLLRQTDAYSLVIEADYQGRAQTHHYVLQTNTIPTLQVSAYQQESHGVVQVHSEDIDGDTLTTFINDSRFVYNTTHFVYENAENGTYDLLITSSDGLVTTEKVIRFIVSPSVNPEGVLELGDLVIHQTGEFERIIELPVHNIGQGTLQINEAIMKVEEQEIVIPSFDLPPSSSTTLYVEHTFTSFNTHTIEASINGQIIQAQTSVGDFSLSIEQMIVHEHTVFFDLELLNPTTEPIENVMIVYNAGDGNAFVSGIQPITLQPGKSLSAYFSHTYDEPGNYTVMVASIGGVTVSESFIVEVKPIPPVIEVSSPVLSVADQTALVQFTLSNPQLARNTEVAWFVELDGKRIIPSQLLSLDHQQELDVFVQHTFENTGDQQVVVGSARTNHSLFAHIIAPDLSITSLGQLAIGNTQLLSFTAYASEPLTELHWTLSPTLSSITPFSLDQDQEIDVYVQHDEDVQEIIISGSGEEISTLI